MQFTQQFADDDWYEFVPTTKQVVRSYGRRSFVYQQQPHVLPNGNMVVKGMRAKSLGLIY